MQTDYMSMLIKVLNNQERLINRKNIMFYR